MGRGPPICRLCYFSHSVNVYNHTTLLFLSSTTFKKKNLQIQYTIYKDVTTPVLYSWALHQKSRFAIWIVLFPVEHEIEPLTGNRTPSAFIFKAVVQKLFKQLYSTVGCSSSSAVLREVWDAWNVRNQERNQWPEELNICTFRIEMGSLNSSISWNRNPKQEMEPSVHVFSKQYVTNYTNLGLE